MLLLSSLSGSHESQLKRKPAPNHCPHLVSQIPKSQFERDWEWQTRHYCMCKQWCLQPCKNLASQQEFHSQTKSQPHQLWLALITTTVLQAKLAFARLTVRDTIKQPQIIKAKSSNPKAIRIAKITNMTSTWINLQIALQVNYHDTVWKGRERNSDNSTIAREAHLLNHSQWNSQLQHPYGGRGTVIGYGNEPHSALLVATSSRTSPLPNRGE